MRIAISARGLSYEYGGAKDYIKNLSRMLPATDPNNKYFIYYSNPLQVLNLELSNLTEVVISSRYSILWDHVFLPLQLIRDKIDVTLYPKCTIPVISPGRKVVSILDLAYFYPGLNAYKFFDTAYMKLMIPLSVRRANAVLAISNHTRCDIFRFIPGISDERINVTYLASALRKESPTGSKSSLEFVAVRQPYIFLSSSLSPRKNIERCLLAFAKIKDAIPHQFVITGGQAWGGGKAHDLAQSLGIADRFVVLGHVDSNDLQHLYKNADFYIMPSLYEGFSLTLLEAMQEGCPVIASNVSSHPEVAGSAALLFDPYSVDAIANAIMEMASNPDLRTRLREEGPRQAAKFSWKRCARETVAVLHEVGAKG